LLDSPGVSADPAAAAPSGVVTFLFTDVEGSTRRWEADAQAMRAALVVHDKVLRTAIEAYDGFLFSHTGDGFVAAFASPMSAVNAAIDAQRELQLPVRMGLATGEAELRDGDYFGTVLNRAARVMAAGHGGQILVAESTAGLLSGVDLLDLGPRRLRDVPTSVQVFQVQAEGLRTDFPSLRALDAGPGNLRPASTSFIGRESELDEVQAAVKAHRLVTLTGVGGVGKTRLASEVAAHLVDEFPDGVWFFELAAVADPAAVPDAAGQHARIRPVMRQPSGGGAKSCGCRFPVAFRPSALASWVFLRPLGSCAFLTVGLPAERSPDPNGVVMLRMNKIRPGRVPPLPRGRWCAPGRRLSSGRHPPLCCGQSLRPRCHIPSAGVTFTRRHRGFAHVHPSPQDDRLPPRSREARPLPAGLLLAHGPRMEREPLRLSTPGFTPRSHPQSMPGRRQALRALARVLHLWHQPNLQTVPPTSLMHPHVAPSHTSLPGPPQGSGRPSRSPTPTPPGH